VKAIIETPAHGYLPQVGEMAWRRPRRPGAAEPSARATVGQGSPNSPINWQRGARSQHGEHARL